MSNPFSQRQAWVVKAFDASITDSSKLLPFQLGFFDYDRKALGNFSESPYVQFAYGSPNGTRKVQSHPKIANLINNDTDVSFKTDKWYGKSLMPARIAKPSKTDQAQVMYVGYDGLNDCNSLDFKCGRTYMFQIKLKPSSATNLIYPEGMMDTIEVTTAACGTCGDDCVDPNVCWSVSDELVAKINSSWVAPYVFAEKVQSCCPVEAAPSTVSFTTYSLTVCDTGDAAALSAVQLQYPTLKIVRTGRINGKSVYEFTQLTATAAPAAFSQSDLIVPPCSTCPAGYTTVAAKKVWIVTADNTGAGTNAAAWLAEVVALGSTYASATAATRIGFQNGTSTYEVLVPTATANPAAVSDVTFYDTGIVTDVYCTLTTPVTTAWVAGATSYKISRQLCIQLDFDDCGGDESNLLAELTAAYVTGSPVENIVTGSLAVETADDCRATFTISQYNNAPLTDGCDTLAVAQFDSLPAFRGQRWDNCPCVGWDVDGDGCPIPPAVVEKNCRCGVKLTGAFMNMETPGCLFDPADAVNYAPVRFEVSVWEIEGPTSAAGLHVNPNIPMYTAKFPKRRYLSGEEVARDVIESRQWHQNEMFVSPRIEMGVKFNISEALEYGADPKKFYYALYLNYNKHGNTTHDFLGQSERRELALYFAEEHYSILLTVLAAYNKYTSSAGINLPVIYI